jgi:hypothetical protein
MPALHAHVFQHRKSAPYAEALVDCQQRKPCNVNAELQL